jgi:hypothetical protein
MNETLIERVRKPSLEVDSIPLSEWREYVQRQSQLRLNEGNIRIQNPRTGEVLEMPGQLGNAELLRNGQWANAFWWKRDAIRFKVPSNCKIHDRNDPFWSIVIDLCSHFNA